MDNFKNKQVLVTGGAGFVGSHLVDRLVTIGAEIVIVDNLITGSEDNIRKALENSTVKFVNADVSEPVSNYVDQDFDYIFHLASPASPKDFESIPKEIYSVNSFGTHNLCNFASKSGSRILFAGTSEAYGDPLEHPQTEGYFGNVNPVGPRACYDESKRFGEMVMSVFAKTDNLDGRLVRIFNTYGPRMKTDDGRVIPAFASQAIKGRPVTVHGGGDQTRSFCYVDDLVEYILRIMLSKQARNQVVNIGNPDEHSMKSLAERIIKLTGSESKINHTPSRKDDPARRKPDISKAMMLTNFEPQIKIDEGLKKTLEYFKGVLAS